MEKLKVGIVGITGIAGIHIPAWLENDQVKLVALCDIDKKELEKQARELAIDNTFTDYKDMLQMEELDVIDICTPNYLHSVIAVDAFKQGKHVFCEKPDAISVEEALKMKEASEKADKLLMVMRNNRFLESSLFLKRYIDKDNLGEIYAAKCGWIRKRGIPGRGGWFTTKSLSGGGPLIDLGVHMIDLVIWLMGNPRPVSVVGSVFNKFTDFEKLTYPAKADKGIFDVEDMANGYIRFENGATLTLEFSWASNIEQSNKYYDLLGTKAGAKLHSTDNKLKIFGEFEGSTLNIFPDIKEKNGHKANIDHFVDCIINDKEPIFTPDQGIDMINILEAIYESAASKREVIL